MFKLIVIITCMIGTSYILAQVFPRAAAVAFVVAGYGITYTLIACLGMGVIAHKITK